VRPHNGRPTVFINGAPCALPIYSPISWRPGFLERSGPRFFRHGMGAYFLGLPQTRNATAWGESPFWEGDTITDSPSSAFAVDLDAQADFILRGDPGAWLIMRNAPMVVPSWLALHTDQRFVDEDGQVMAVPSLASDAWWTACARAVAASVRYCERRPWAARLIGYWNGMFHEGTHPPLFRGLLFDHGPAMRERWRRWLRERYGTDAELRRAWNEPAAGLDSAGVPRDRLRGKTPDVAAQLYWQTGTDNAPLRDYLLLQAALVHNGMRRLFEAQRAATDRQRIFVTDALKQPMQGWSNGGFFDERCPWPLAYPETMAGSGSMAAAELLDHPGLDGLVTPVDYQVRGVGGITEPEGAADSAVLRGKCFLAECDVRTWHDDVEEGRYGTARDRREFAAINWRSIASGLTRGFNPYWMDLVGDWFGSDGIQAVIGRSVQVVRDSVNWEHRDVPGIAMVLDDAAALDTNGAGNFPNEAVMWELKCGLARCGVPYRVYLLEDLALERFPPHRLFYFPNLFRVTDAKLRLLRERVFRDGNAVVWGPGSGLSDGERIGPDSAERLTGFAFELLNVNHPRRTHVQRFDHPITAGLAADTIYGSPLAYGPVLYPTDGLSLGLCWTKAGRNRSGLAVKTLGAGAAGDGAAGRAARGAGDWASVFTTAVPLPAGLWRNLARYSGTHVYCESNDILLADSSIVALHSIQSGRKVLRLPGRFDVEDLVAGSPVGTGLASIAFELNAPETRVFRLT
jgi:hypothetical protein